MAFTHLHVHTEYSLLDGAARIGDIVARAAELGMDALAITDHGGMFGVIDFYKAAREAGIKPILGCEVYTAARTMEDKDPDRDKHQGHLVLLAKNRQGYQNLIKIVSEGYLRGFYYKPRIDKSVLRKYSGGIIALSACLAGDVQRKLLNGDYPGAKAEALEFLEIFGPGNFYLELQDQGLEEQRAILEDMVRLRDETGIPFAATNDVHYVRQEDAAAHDVLLCIQTVTNVDDENRMRFPNDQFYLKSDEEMRAVFARFPEAVENTEKIAAACDLELPFGELHLPEFQAPEGKNNRDFLEELCRKGLAERYEPVTPELRERLEYELETIRQMGYVEYFLIVWDFINYARQNKIMVGPGRGSAAGSLVAYCLRITDIDPIKYGLIFERFLNPERISMPDIDIDFCYERRQEVINYVVEKYGEDKVAQIITFGTMKAKAAVRDVARALNLSYQEADVIAKAIPFDLKMTIDRALEANPELRAMYEENPRVARVLDTARRLEGLARHASTHAAGVVISKESMWEYVPLYLAEKGVSTQFPMTTIEELGLLKMDFLGLRNLTVIRDALEMIEADHGVTVDFSKMDYDDPAVYRLISEGNTQGMFQLESGGMTQFMKNLKPDCFEDIVAGISLYRPGPMNSIPLYIENKKNPEKISYLHESLEPILSVTYGCLVYQEQVMQIVRDLAGYSYGRSDIVRRAMGKKKRDVMLKEQEFFVRGAMERKGLSKEVAGEIFGQMITFAEYAFNKSHAAAYAVIAYQTAWLKTHYPVEFMAALMSSVIGDSDQIAKYIRNCAEMNIPVLPPSVNESHSKFTVSDGAIRFGLRGVKNVGEGVIRAIIRMREEKGVPRDIFRFVQDIDIHEINKKAMESLIKSGAMDCLGGNRAQLLAVYEGLLESAQSSSRKNIQGQLSLFQVNEEEMTASGSGAELPQVAEFSRELRMAQEKEMAGVYLSGHPLDDYREMIEKRATLTSEDINGDMETACILDGTRGTLAGIVTGKKVQITRNNRQMAFVTLEDLYGALEVIMFPNVYEQFAASVREDAVLAVTGSVSKKEDEPPKLIADKITDLRQLKEASSFPEEEGGDVAGAGKKRQPERTPDKSGGSLLSAEGSGGPPADPEAEDGPASGAGSASGNGKNGGVKTAAPMVKLTIPARNDETVVLARLREILKAFPGPVPVAIRIERTGQKFKTDRELWVAPGADLERKLNRLGLQVELPDR